jgi:hypothetical protein
VQNFNPKLEVAQKYPIYRHFFGGFADFIGSSHKNIKFFWIFCRKYDKELLAILKKAFYRKINSHLSRMGDI